MNILDQGRAPKEWADNWTAKQIETVQLIQCLKREGEKPGDTLLRALRFLNAHGNEKSSGREDS